MPICSPPRLTCFWRCKKCCPRTAWRTSALGHRCVEFKPKSKPAPRSPAPQVPAMISQSVVLRFSKFVAKGSKCWLWTGAVDHRGYGRFFFDRKPRRAHRVAWQIANGREPSPGLLVMHRCDTPACVNPAHLKLATKAENDADCKAKGRHSHGARNGNSKLTDAIVRKIKASRLPSKILAPKYQVSPTTINRIRSGERWAHIGDPA